MGKEEIKPIQGVAVFIDTADNFHPYECNPSTCIHCAGKVTKEHDPSKCALCQDE